LGTFSVDELQLVPFMRDWVEPKPKLIVVQKLFFSAMSRSAKICVAVGQGNISLNLICSYAVSPTCQSHGQTRLGI